MRKVFLITLVLLSLWAGHYYWSNYTLAGKVDACMDNGGVWNYGRDECEGARE